MCKMSHSLCPQCTCVAMKKLQMCSMLRMLTDSAACNLSAIHFLFRVMRCIFGCPMMMNHCWQSFEPINCFLFAWCQCDMMFCIQIQSNFSGRVGKHSCCKGTTVQVRPTEKNLKSDHVTSYFIRQVAHSCCP